MVAEALRSGSRLQSGRCIDLRNATFVQRQCEDYLRGRNYEVEVRHDEGAAAILPSLDVVFSGTIEGLKSSCHQTYPSTLSEQVKERVRDDFKDFETLMRALRMQSIYRNSRSGFHRNTQWQYEAQLEKDFAKLQRLGVSEAVRNVSSGIASGKFVFIGEGWLATDFFDFNPMNLARRSLGVSSKGLCTLQQTIEYVETHARAPWHFTVQGKLIRNEGPYHIIAEGISESDYRSFINNRGTFQEIADRINRLDAITTPFF